MDEKVKALVLKLQDILSMQTGNYPDVNKALTSLRDYVQEKTATKRGVEDKLKKLEDILLQKSEKKKKCTDHIQKIRAAMCLPKKPTTATSKPKGVKREASSSSTSERATPMPHQTKENNTLRKPPSSAASNRATPLTNQKKKNNKLRSDLTQVEETTELSGKNDQNDEEDISQMKTENQYLRKTIEGLFKYIIGGDETTLNELKTSKHKKDNQTITEVEANVKEVTQTLHELKTNVENVTEESKCLFSIMECLINHAKGLYDGNTETDRSSALIQSLDQIKSSVKKESPANQFLTQAKEIIGIQMEWKREFEYVSYLLGELAKVSQTTNNGDKKIILSHPENLESPQDNGNKKESSRNKPMKSVRKEKLMRHYDNALFILQQMKENENLRIDIGKKKDEVPDLMRRLKQLQDENIEIQKEANSLRTRLSEHAGALLTYDNPSIADLSDPNRPTKLSEMYLELNDNKWTDAFANVAKEDPDISEEKNVGYLYEMLVDGYRFCEDVRRKQILALEDILFNPAGGMKTSQKRQNEKISVILAKQLSDVSKLSSNVSSVHMAEAFVMEEKTKDKFRKMTKLCETYIQECVQLCWLMQVQTPPLYLDLKTIKGHKFDKNFYREYTKKGNRIAFVVWPALFLHENGPLLIKGIAQGQ